MACYQCGKESVDRCYQCGRLFCEQHGSTDCQLCQNAIREGDPSPERVSTRRRSPDAVNAWWRPKEADDFVPPACHVCGGLTRATCTGCGQRYCAEHAGRNFQCRSCSAAADTSLWIAGLVILAFAALGLAAWFVST